MFQFPSDHPDYGKGHVGGSQAAGDKKAGKIYFRAAKRKTQSTPTSRVVQEGSKSAPEQQAYTLGLGGCLILFVMLLMIVAAFASVIARRGAL